LNRSMPVYTPTRLRRTGCPAAAKPPWLVTAAPQPSVMERMTRALEQGRLSTVCEWAVCPNIGECYSRGTATFLILGRVCTRHCAFCPLATGGPGEPDAAEPERVAQMVRSLRLEHVVITSVTRDDLPDGGAGHFAATVLAIKKICRGTSVEVLIPDFQGSRRAVATVTGAGPDVIGHNVETVPRLYPAVRPGAGYRRSLDLLALVKQTAAGVRTKSGLMLGLGETEDELKRTMRDLRRAGCDFLTLGQYLQPDENHHPVVAWITPEQFGLYRDVALDLGFKQVLSSPLARSSYRAGEMFRRGLPL